MRWIFPILAMAISVLSATLDFHPVSADSHLCRWGLCRFDQLYSALDATGLNPRNAGAILNQDAANPSAWCTYAESLAAAGRTAEASSAFDHAIDLGPSMPPVLMRAANFEFTRSRADLGIPLARRVLEQTGAFDQILYSYLTRLNVPAAGLVGIAIPAAPRPARSWMGWIGARGSEQNVEATWSWMRQNQLAGEQDAVALAWALWQRGKFSLAQKVWVDWTGSADPEYLHPQRLTNRAFARESNGSPFDWTLAVPESVQLSRRDGLDLRFSGSENVSFSHVRQYAAVDAGRYRFSAEISSVGLTTEALPFFHIFDPVNSARVNVETGQVPATVPRLSISLDFEVPRGTEALVVQIERRATQRFDRNIAGTLHVYRVSLVALGVPH
jgi:hypothetical protein